VDADRIKEIQDGTAYPDSISVQQALLQVWNECAQSAKKIEEVPGAGVELPKEFKEATDPFLSAYGVLNALPSDVMPEPNTPLQAVLPKA
jgi:hypothetical protein